MTGDPFYHNSIRKLVVAFSTLFNDISIERLAADGTVDSTIKIPIQFSRKARWYRKLREEIGDQPKSISRLLPRMGFDLLSLRYDSSRSGVATTVHTADVPVLDSSSSSTSNRFTQRKRSYRRVPYIYDFELSIAAKTMTDGLMILEQILPFFKPDISVTINDIDSLNIDTDVSIVLRDVTKDDNRLDGSFDEIDLVTWTLGFELRGYLYSPISDTNVILSTDINLYDKLQEDNPSRVAVIEADVVDGVDFDIDDPDTFTSVITEFDYYHSSSSSSG